MQMIRIGNHQIGPGQRVFVIAEIGVNHDGSAQRAVELVEFAARAGADAVKLQIFQAAALMHPSSAFATYQKERVEDADPAAMLRRYELSAADLGRIIGAIRQRGMVPLATPFSPADVETIRKLDLPGVKIASPDLVNHVLLKEVLKLGRPMILSAGAATMEEAVESAAWLRERRAEFGLMHCVSSYPAKEEDANLGWIGEMTGKLGVPVGYSDHTTEPLAGGMAVAAGAVMVEKHLTYDRRASGPDHAASADPVQLGEYIRTVRLAEKLRGTGLKRVLEAEQDVRKVSRQSLVSTRDLSAGHVLREGDLTVQRPGTGILGNEIERVIGRNLVRALRAGQMLEWGDLA